MKAKRSSLFTLAAVLFAVTAHAQTGTGRISGVVKDSSGGSIPGATVTALHEQTGIRHSTTTTASGAFVFPSLSIGPYSVICELQGFKRVTRTGNMLDVAADLNLTITMEPGGLEESVTVTAENKLVQNTESSLSMLVNEQTIVTLPLNGRNPLHLIGLVPGVVGHSAEATASGGTSTQYINGDRGRGITTTQDGIDIGDPVIPRGELTNAPVNPDAVEQFRLISSNPKAEYGRTAGGQVEMVTKSGTNQLKGSAYEFMRQTALDSNSHFNKLRGLPKEQLSRHQFGATLGGPIKRDKMFFFVNYDGQRRTQDTSQVVTVPTASLRNGLFRFVTAPCAGGTTVANRPGCVDASGNPLVPVSSYSFVGNDPRGLGLDPVVQNETLKFLPLPNDFTGGDGLNFASYRWNSPSKSPVDTVIGKFDYTVNAKHSAFVRYSTSIRNDLINDIINTNPRPLSWPARVRLSDQQASAFGVKSTLTPHLLNEVTGGFTRNVLDFADPEHPRTYQIRVPVVTTPLVYWPGTGRTPIEAHFLDNVSYVRSNHAFKAGVSVRAYYIDQQRGAGNPFGIYPAFTFARTDAPFSGADANAVIRPDGSRANLTGSGINSTDSNNLQSLYNLMLGRIGRIDQVFYSNGEKYVPLEPLRLKQRLQEYNFFLQDDWRMSSKLTINAGVRYELNSVPYDKSGVQVVPDKPLDGSQGPVTFLPAGPGTGRSWYKNDKNNVAPVIGFAFDPKANGKTAIRGSYRISYQRLVSWALNVVEQRQPATALNQFLLTPRVGAIGGTDTTVRLNELLNGGRLPDQQRDVTLSLANGIPQLSAPATINRTPAPIRGEQPFAFQGEYATPFVQQWSGGIQRQLGSSLMVEANYVGSRGMNLFRMLNVNQMDLNANGFVSDFLAAQRNLAATGNPNTGDPTGNLGRLYGGTIPTTAFADIRNGNIGTVANSLDLGTAGIGLAAAGLPNTFFRPSPQFTLAGVGCTCSNSWYNSLQLQVQGRLSKSLQFAANYSYSKATDDNSNDTNGAGTNVIVPSDPKRPALDKGRSDFDVTHTAHAYAIWDLPVGKGRRFLGDAPRLLDWILGGWQVNGILDMSSGFPFTVFSGFNTFTFYDAGTNVASTGGTSNRAVYTGNNTNIGTVTRTATGVEFFSAEEKALFKTPAPGEVGSERNMFTGPGFFQFDLGLFKNFKLDDRRRLELRMEVFNLFDTVNFSQPNANLSSATFGQITGTRIPPRTIQFGAKMYF